jgi:hypothetical protein
LPLLILVCGFTIGEFGRPSVWFLCWSFNSFVALLHVFVPLVQSLALPVNLAFVRPDLDFPFGPAVSPLEVF